MFCRPPPVKTSVHAMLAASSLCWPPPEQSSNSGLPEATLMPSAHAMQATAMADVHQQCPLPKPLRCQVPTPCRPPPWQKCTSSALFRCHFEVKAFFVQATSMADVHNQCPLPKPLRCQVSTLCRPPAGEDKCPQHARHIQSQGSRCHFDAKCPCNAGNLQSE